MKIGSLKNKLDKITSKALENLEPIKWPKEFTEDQQEAIDIAVKNGLEYEVCEAMFNMNMSPEEALREWDLL